MDRQPSTLTEDPGHPPAGVKPAQGVLARIFTRHFFYVPLLAALPVAFGEGLNARLTLLRDPDIWWHLADARLLFSTGHFIQTEPYSFTVAGQPWINPEWLAELPYWFGYRATGFCGIYLVAWLAICANILLVYWRSFRATRSADASFWAAGIGFVLMAVNVGPRTIAFGYMALSLEMLILEAAGHGNRRLLWLLPPLFCLWVNLHGTWLIGLALLALYSAAGYAHVGMGALQQQPFSSADHRRHAVIVGASIAALFVNPYGWRLVWNPLDMILNQRVNIATVAEWKPLNVGTLEGATLVIVIVLMVLANLKCGRTWTLFDLAVVVFGCYAAVDHVRFLYLAAVLIGPALAMDIARSFSPEPNQKTIPAMNALIAAAALGFVAVMFPSETKLQARLSEEFPLHMIGAIQPGWRTFNTDYVGGMMAFESRPSLIDSRVDTFEHNGVFQNYLAAMNLDKSLEVLDFYRLDHALLATGQPLDYLLERTPGWAVLMREKIGEGEYILLVKTASGGSTAASQTRAPAATPSAP
jgi:hypothetical protein